ncbi:MAG: hypothetical protein JJW00_04220 [Sulfurimonas sp.]|nr:hypothetical protein [Sulfurimonas sp.]
MEIKDAILSTLAEIESHEVSKKVLNSSIEIKPKIKPKIRTKEKLIVKEVKPITTTNAKGEVLFLNSLKERLLVLFEGFQAPNNTNIDAKLDMTLNFLEYALASIEERTQELEKGDHK